LEHLRPNGRAAVIIPEGIIFIEDNVYKKLRKKLVEDSLIGVISLPAGVFQPYSDVKTSILILDRIMSQKCDDIFFANVENDGYSLTTSRKKVQGNELELVRVSLNRFLEGKSNFDYGFTLKKTKLEQSGFSFNQNKYIKTETVTEFSLVRLGEFIKESKTKYNGENENILDVNVGVVKLNKNPLSVLLGFAHPNNVKGYWLIGSRRE
jgi:type I restriction enzyme M protein